jgi:hypothetical protein
MWAPSPGMGDIWLKPILKQINYVLADIGQELEQKLLNISDCARRTEVLQTDLEAMRARATRNVKTWMFRMLCNEEIGIRRATDDGIREQLSLSARKHKLTRHPSTSSRN